MIPPRFLPKRRTLKMRHLPDAEWRTGAGPVRTREWLYAYLALAGLTLFDVLICYLAWRFLP